MKKNWILTLIILAAIIFIPVTVRSEAANLSQNPGFEQGEAAEPYFWMKSSWENKGQFSWDTNTRHSGQRSAAIINTTATDTRYRQQLAVKPNTFYRLSCWILTENVGLNAKGANISIDGLLESSRDIRGTSKTWEYVEVAGKTGPDQQNLIMTLGLGGYGSLNTGKAWFDDITVEELTKEPSQGTILKLYIDTSAKPPAVAKSSNRLWLILFILLLLAVILVSVIFMFFRIQKAKSNQLSPKVPLVNGANPELISPQLKLDRQDFTIMGTMTLVYLILALVNLGSWKVPETQWLPAKSGESFVIDLGKETRLSKIYYYCGLGEGRDAEGKYRLQYLDAAGKYQPYATIEKKDLFIWKTVNTPDTPVRKLQLLVDSPGGTLNELGFFEKGNSTPLEGIKIVEKTAAVGAVENLLDEQERIDYKHSYLSGMIFDEIYHARTAYEHLHRMSAFEWTHPPLGKVFISLGIFLFGMNPFGWRIIGTLFGVAMVPIMYLFGRKVFGEKFYGFCAAFLMMFDFMHFGLTRIATIDVYGTFFVILMYYFMFDYFARKSYDVGFSQSLRPLFWSGLFFGIGAACKWISVYAGGGLALLFFTQKILEYRDYRQYQKQDELSRPAWFKDFMRLYMVRTLLACVLFFVLIPAAIYALSYIPYLLVPGETPDVILRNQKDMFTYHSKGVLGATHPFSSFWWEWPLITKPLMTYSGTDLPAGISSTMSIFGNPAVWWAGIAAVIAAFVTAVRKRDKKMLVIFTAIAFQYLPWVGVKRIVFIYHFFSTVPFLILSIVYIIKTLLEKASDTKYIIYAYLFIVAFLFAMFYPVLSGLEVSRWYVEQFLVWFRGSWFF